MLLYIGLAEAEVPEAVAWAASVRMVPEDDSRLLMHAVLTS